MKTNEVQTILDDFKNEMSYVDRVELLELMQDRLIYWAMESGEMQDDVKNLLDAMFIIRRLKKLLTDLNNATK